MSNSKHPCKSAKALIPKQFVGCNWDCRKSQQASLTSVNWSKCAAGNSTWTFSSVTFKIYYTISKIYFSYSKYPYMHFWCVRIFN